MALLALLSPSAFLSSMLSQCQRLVTVMAALPFHSSQELRLSIVTLRKNNIISNNNTSRAHHLLSYIPYTCLTFALSMKAIVIIVT